MHSYTSAISTVKDAKYVLFLNIYVQSYSGTVEIRQKKILKPKSANALSCSCNYFNRDFFFYSHPHIKYQKQNNEQQWTRDLFD